MVNKNDEVYLEIMESINTACIEGHHYCKYPFDSADIPNDAIDTLLDDGYVVSFATNVSDFNHTYILVEWYAI